MNQSVSSNVSNDVSELAELRSQIWEKYRFALTILPEVKDLAVHVSEISVTGATQLGINALGSGDNPVQETALAIQEVHKEKESIRLLEAEIKGLEEEIKRVESTYIAWGIGVLLIVLSIWLWHIGWFVQVLLCLAVFYLRYPQKASMLIRKLFQRG
jgi:hypothetical protein